MRLLGLALLFTTSTALAQDAPPPAATPTPTHEEEVEQLLRELEKETAALPAPLPEPRPRVVPSWVDAVVPVLGVRFQPFVHLGHPTSLQRPQVLGRARARLGAEVHPLADVAARVVLLAGTELPGLRAPGPELLHDAWVQWMYQALGGTVRLRVGRQEVVMSDLAVFSPDYEFPLIPPRYDGVTLRVTWNQVFLHGAALVEALRVIPAAGTFPDVNGIAALSTGIEDGPGKLVEAHALVRVPRLPVHGDAGPQDAGRPLLDLGGSASWSWRGLRGLAALDLQQSEFQAPSVFAPPVATSLEAGYAPDFPWAQGVYADAGFRAAAGTPARYLPLVGGLGAWDGVVNQEFNQLYGNPHGRFGQMDLGMFQNMWTVFGRVGLRRGALRNLSVTLHRISLLDARAAWVRPFPDREVTRAGQGGGDPLIGHEVDLVAEAELTRHVVLGGSVGLLASGPKARDAGFGAVAQTTFVTLDLRL